MMTEVWQAIPSHPGVVASSEGRVMVVPHLARSTHGRRGNGIMVGGTPRTGCKCKQGYRTTLGGKSFLVHRLICEAFHGPAPFARAVVMHLNENCYDNRPVNLAWGTQKENLNAPGFLAYCRSRTGANSPAAKAATARAR